MEIASRIVWVALGAMFMKIAIISFQENASRVGLFLEGVMLLKIVTLPREYAS